MCELSKIKRYLAAANRVIEAQADADQAVVSILRNSGLSVRKMAKRTGYSPAYVSLVMNWKTPPSPAFIAAVGKLAEEMSIAMSDYPQRMWKWRHDQRSEYAILKRAPEGAAVDGWTRLGTMTHWTDGYGWKALDGIDSTLRYKTKRACLNAFTEEMQRRRAMWSP